MLIAFGFRAVAAEVGSAYVESSRVGSATHFEFKGLPSWKYDVKREKGARGDVVILRAPKLSAASLGKLRVHQDAMIESVSVTEGALDEQTEIAFHLKTKTVDSFDYVSDQPSRLILDFFPKDEKASAENESDESALEAGQGSPKAAAPVAAKSASALPPKTKTAATKGDAKTSKLARKPAATEFGLAPGADESPAGGGSTGEAASGLKEAKQYGLFDAADPTYKRFSAQDWEIKEESIIASRANVYLRFPMLKLEMPQLKALLASPPIYEIVPQEDEENQQARLIQTLFNNKRPAVFLKTAKEFLKRWPESRYEEIVKYLVADQRLAFWRADAAQVDDFDAAVSMYRSLAERHPDSPLAPRTSLLVGYLYLSRGDAAQALQTFQRVLRESPKAKTSDTTKIALAQSFLMLDRYDEALAALDDVEAHGANDRDRAEAAYRKGDVAFQKRDFEGAITGYRRAEKAWPKFESDLPNAAFNLAEAAFWTARYKESMNGFREFLASHPDHPFGGFALARLGELMEILGPGSKRATGAWMESTFRYRGTVGAGVSRVRVLASRMAEMKGKELTNATREIDGIVAKSDLPNFVEFATLLKADGTFARGDYAGAANALIRFYQQNPQAPDLPKVKERIVRALNQEIRSDVEKGDFLQALKRNEELSKSWMKDSDRVDTEFYVGRAYEQAGLTKDAAETYRSAINKLYAAKGTPREKERGVFEQLPSSDSLNLRLAATSASDRDFARAQNYLKAIVKPAELSEPERIERAESAADVAEARGQSDVARKNLEELVNTWTGRPAAVAPVYLRLAKGAAEAREWKAAGANVAKILDLQADAGNVPPDAHAGALELKGEIAAKRGRRAEATRAYRALLDQYEGQRPLGSVRYKLGQLLFEMGQIKEAEVAWSGLKPGADDVWTKLAAERMQSAKWQAEYSKYIRRIPAMADMRDSDGDAAASVAPK